MSTGEYVRQRLLKLADSFPPELADILRVEATALYTELTQIRVADAARERAAAFQLLREVQAKLSPIPDDASPTLASRIAGLLADEHPTPE